MTLSCKVDAFRDMQTWTDERQASSAVSIMQTQRIQGHADLNR